MAFHSRRYLVDVLLGDPAAEPLWAWATWSLLAPSLDALMCSARGKTTVRSLQYAARKPVAFGRIGWNTKGHQKWTHGSPLSSDQERLFSSVEAWAPSWTISEKENCPPDTFLLIQNETAIFLKDVSFNPTVLLATAADCHALGAPRAAAVNALASRVRPLLHVRQDRAWGKPSGIGFTDAIQDLVFTGLFKPGSRHGALPTVDTFSEAWEEVGAG